MSKKVSAKKRAISRRMWIGLAGVVVVILAAILIPSFMPKTWGKFDDFVSRDKIKNMSGELITGARKIKNPNQIYEEITQDGEIADHVIGKKDAKVTVFAYFDWANKDGVKVDETLSKIIEKYKEDVAVVYRNYFLFTEESERNVRMAAATEAAGKQGLWKEFRDTALAKYDDWAELEGEELNNRIAVYVKDLGGDADKLFDDMKTEQVAQKLAFDMACGNHIVWRDGAALSVDGEEVTINGLTSVIEKKIAE